MSKDIHSVASTNFALFAYDTGFEDALNQLLEAIDKEEAGLRKYGRTELYGLSKTRSLILKLKAPTQTQEGE